MNAATGAIINIPLHSLFRKVSVELNGRSVSDPNQMYQYCTYIDTLLNYSMETPKTRLLSEGCIRDTANQLAVTAAGGANTDLNTRTVMFAESKTVELVGRPHVDVFQ